MQRYRRAFREKVIPRFYSGRAHLIIFFLLEMIALVWTGAQVDWTLGSPFFILLTLAYATTFTYFLHRFILHRRVPGFSWAHKMHHWHHTFYTSGVMEYDELDDVYMLLMPPWIQVFYYLVYLPLLIVILKPLLPMALVLHFIFAMTLWYALYESVHWVSHLPLDHVLLKVPGLRWMRQHHQVHHSRLKDVANFGIVEPGLDFFRTKK
ncbi:MAG TPA: sterol desaturase family protein [Bacteriovoracaceae bacterium]|nr:sterol desaturase family protein [Bacteriovoracaceae bacterium]